MSEQQLKETQLERAMSEAFNRAAMGILQNEPRFVKHPGLLRMGLEMEASLTLKNGEPLSEVERDEIVETHAQFADKELGASQIEWRTDPVILNTGGGLASLFTQASERSGLLEQSVNHHDAVILRSGTNPFIPIPQIIRTNKQKYRLVPDFHNDHRIRTDTLIGEVAQIDVGDAAVVALLNSLQCNLEAISFTDAVDMANRSLMIGPLVVALSGNARFLAGVDSGMNDLRITAWEISHDVRTDEERRVGKALRVGLPNDYFTDMADYFYRVGQHPFILDDPEHALQIGIGLFWQDTRIKVIGDSLVVEFRPISIQPTVEEDLATMLFYLGRLQWSKLHGETLLPIEQVRENRALAIINGIKPFQSVLPEEIDRAQSALLEIGVDPQIKTFLDILRVRVSVGMTPSDQIAQKVKEAKNKTTDSLQAMKIAFSLMQS